MTGKATTQFLLSYGAWNIQIKSTSLDAFGRLLPQWLPFHPSRWWVHTRTIYVPMSYLYGVKFKAAEDPLILALREVGSQHYILVGSVGSHAQKRNCIPKFTIRSIGPLREIMSPKRTSIHLIASCSISSPWSLVHMNSVVSRRSAMLA